MLLNVVENFQKSRNRQRGQKHPPQFHRKVVVGVILPRAKGVIAKGSGDEAASVLYAAGRQRAGANWLANCPKRLMLDCGVR